MEKLENVALESTRTIEVDEFVDRSEIDPRHLTRPFCLRPDGKVGHDAFAVIRQTIREMNKVAIGRVVLTNGEHIIALEPLENGMTLGRTMALALLDIGSTPAVTLFCDIRFFVARSHSCRSCRCIGGPEGPLPRMDRTHQLLCLSRPRRQRRTAQVRSTPEPHVATSREQSLRICAAPSRPACLTGFGDGEDDRFHFVSKG